MNARRPPHPVTRRIERLAHAKAYAEGIKAVVERVAASMDQKTGVVEAAATELGWPAHKLSRILNHQKYLRPWWFKFKDELRKTRRRRRQAKVRARGPQPIF